jgi:uncharacterized protein (DUF169 family)
MDMQFKERFATLWDRYFPQAPLPVVFFYSDDEAGAAVVKGPKSLEEHRCILADITRAARGRSLAFNVDSIGCGGGRKYLGFTEVLRPNFEYFLSCGIPGELEGERYKKSPELVGKVMKKMPRFSAPDRYIVFKRWDGIDRNDNPDVVIFFATPDVLSGLFTLANYDGVDPNGVFCPFGAGCSTIVTYPYLERMPPPEVRHRHVRRLRPPLRPGKHPHLRHALQEARDDGEQHGRKLPHNGKLEKGKEEN